MTKKELKERLKNIPKDKYIYQRYDGQIHKFLVGEQYLLDTETGINVSESMMLLGKTSENLIDLIEEGDILLTEENRIIFAMYMEDKEIIEDWKEDIEKGCVKLLLILTKEQYEANCYKVKEE